MKSVTVFKRKNIWTGIALLLVTSASYSLHSGDSLSAGAPAGPAAFADYTFSSDLLEQAHGNWIRSNNAELITLGTPEPDRYGYRMTARYRLPGDNVTVHYYLNARWEIYDVGESLASYPFDEPAAMERILSRMIWARTLDAPKLLSGMWHLASRSVDVSYDRVIGGEEQILREFLADMREGDPDIQFFRIASEEQEYEAEFTLNDRKLTFRIRPSLFLYLNGQLHIIPTHMKTMIEGSLKPQEISKVHDYHRFRYDKQSFQLILPDRERRLIRLIYESGDQGWRRKSIEPEREDQTVSSELEDMVFDYWLTRNFPEEFRIAPQIRRDELEVNITMEGDEQVFRADVRDGFPGQLGWFGDRMMTHVEVNPAGNQDESRLFTTYVLYYDPVLAYQHMMRVHDEFEQYGSQWHWIRSDVHMLPAVRLDNLDEAFGGDLFPEDEYEKHFKRTTYE